MSGDPDVIDQIIRALGLGSSGQRYRSGNTNQTSGSRYRRADLVDLTAAGCDTPTISPPRKVCLEYTVTNNQGKANVCLCQSQHYFSTQ